MCRITRDCDELCGKYLTAFQAFEPVAMELDRVSTELRSYIQIADVYPDHKAEEPYAIEVMQRISTSTAEFNEVMKLYKKGKRRVDRVKAKCQEWV